MLKLAVRNITSRKLRFALTALSIMLGTAMMSGTYVLSDQITGAFDEIFAKANQGVDVIVTGKQAFTSQNGNAADPIPQELVTTVRAIDGVASAEGQADGFGSLVLDGKSVTSVGGAPALLVSLPQDERFKVTTTASGRMPSARNEVAVDVAFAEREKLALGTKLEVATDTGLHPATLVGTFKFADTTSLGGAIIIVTTFADAQEWLDRKGEVTSIVVAGTTGTDPAALKQRIEAALGKDTYRIETGTESADRQAADVNEGLGFLTQTLTIFALIAILVGSFVIYNVFSITIAQRIREIAMLRTIGASRGQLRGSVLIEALIVGLIASLLGIALGVLIAIGLKAMFGAAGFGLPTAAITIKPRTVLIPLAVGTAVTVLSAIIPATRATRISPVAALREGAVLPKTRFSGYVPWLGLVAAVIGVIMIFAGFGSEGALRNRLLLIAGGAVFIVIGIGLAMRLMIRPLANLIGRPLQGMFGNSANIARQNTMRDPARTASTAMALMIGVGLVVFIAVFVHGFKVSLFDSIDRTIRADQLTLSENFIPFAPGAIERARATPGIDTAVGIGVIESQVDGTTASMSAIDPTAAKSLVRFDWTQGSDALLDQLGTDGTVVEDGFASDRGLSVGDTFEVLAINGRRATFRVLGTYRDPQLFTGYTISDAALARLTDNPQYFLLLTKGSGTEALASSLKASYPTLKVRTKAEYKDFINSTISIFLNIFYALLALSVIVSLVGIVITLILAIYERTREIGMLRAVGTTRGQIRWMILHEGVITCVIGGIVGLFVGLLLGWVITKGLEGEGLGFAVPYGTLGAVLVLTIVAGLLAAFLPSRRAAKLRPLEALHYE